MGRKEGSVWRCIAPISLTPLSSNEPLLPSLSLLSTEQCSALQCVSAHCKIVLSLQGGQQAVTECSWCNSAISCSVCTVWQWPVTSAKLYFQLYLPLSLLHLPTIKGAVVFSSIKLLFGQSCEHSQKKHHNFISCNALQSLQCRRLCCLNSFITYTFLMCILWRCTATCILLNGRSGTISSDERWTLDTVVPLTLESVRFLESVHPVFIEHFLAPLCPKYRTITSSSVRWHNLLPRKCSVNNLSSVHWKQRLPSLSKVWTRNWPSPTAVSIDSISFLESV